MRSWTAASGYGLEAWTNLEQRRRTMRGSKRRTENWARNSGPLGKRSSDWKSAAAIPKRVPVQSVTQEPVVKLAPERKHLTNLIKMGLPG